MDYVLERLLPHTKGSHGSAVSAEAQKDEMDVGREMIVEDF
jgi:hypothetical protein